MPVPDGREALAWLSAAWHGFPTRQLIVIGVTGTDGNTTTVNAPDDPDVFHIYAGGGTYSVTLTVMDADSC